MPETHIFLPLLPLPDLAFVQTTAGVQPLVLSSLSNLWQRDDVQVATIIHPDRLSISLTATETPILRLHLRWLGDLSGVKRWLGDAWERGYGDLEWRGIVPERPMPWYCAGWDGARTHGYGVATGPSAFCFWQADTDGLSLWMDVRSGGAALELNGRTLAVCDVVCREGQADETPFTSLCELKAPGFSHGDENSPRPQDEIFLPVGYNKL